MYTYVLILIIIIALEIVHSTRKTDNDPVKQFYIDNERFYPEDHSGSKYNIN